MEERNTKYVDKTLAIANGQLPTSLAVGWYARVALPTLHYLMQFTNPPLRLRRLEITLLGKLFRPPGHVLSRLTTAEAASWGVPAFPLIDVATVAVQLRAARKTFAALALWSDF